MDNAHAHIHAHMRSTHTHTHTYISIKVAKKKKIHCKHYSLLEDNQVNVFGVHKFDSHWVYFYK
jgi:hypothetical protein